MALRCRRRGRDGWRLHRQPCVIDSSLVGILQQVVRLAQLLELSGRLRWRQRSGVGVEGFAAATEGLTQGQRVSLRGHAQTFVVARCAAHTSNGRPRLDQKGEASS